MNTTWIIVAAAVLVALLVLALVIGLALRKKNQISLSKPEEKAELTQQDRSGNYQASTGFNFTTAGAAGAAGAGAAGVTGLKEPERIDEPLGGAGEKPGAGPATPAEQVAPLPEPDTAAEPDPGEAAAPTAAPAATPTGADEAPADTDTAAAAETTAPHATGDRPGAADPAEVSLEEYDETETAAQAAGAGAPVVETGDSVTTPVAPPTETQRDQIAPPEGRMNRLRGRLSRSNNTVGKGLLGLLGAGDLDEESWEEIEDTLIMADLGTTTTMRVVERLRADIASQQVRTEAEVRQLLRAALIDNLHPEMDRSIKALPNNGKPAVILVVGVNGTGKTTTTGKLARVLVASGRTILLGAADTFRAAAADQLQTWGERVGAETVRGKEGGDPAAIAFDAVARGIDTGVDAVLVDTAGRLHTKAGLMDQLGKVKRVVEKKTEVDEVLLVIDATTGQNGLQQARVFRDVVDITGVVLTKLDGTAKGGIVFQVQHELGVPVKLVGLGEGADDLAPFVPESFVDALLA